MKKRTIKSILIMGLSSIIGYFVTLYLTAYITENIGIEAYGFVSLAKNIVSYGGIATAALTSFIVRYVSVAYHSGDKEEAKSYFVSSIKSSVILCFILTIIFSLLVFKLEYVINVPTELVASVKVLFVFVFLSFVFTTITTPFGTGFYIKDRLDISGIIKIVSYFSEIGSLCVLFSLFKPSVWFVGFGVFSAALTVFIGTYFSNKKLLPDFKYRRNMFSAEKVKNLFSNGMWNSVNQLGNTLNSGLDLVVSNALLSGIQTGQIAVAKSIGVIFGTLSSVIFQPLQPELLKNYSNGVNDVFLRSLRKTMKICGFFGAIAFSGFFSLGMLFFRTWLPNQDTNILYMLTLLTVATYVMDIFLQPIYYVSALTLKNRVPCLVTIGGGVVNVVGMYLLIKYTNLSIYAVPVTTLVIMLLINIIFNPIYACMCLKIKKTYFYPMIFRHLGATVIMCVLFFVLSNIFNPEGWIGLCVCVILFTIIGIFAYVTIIMNREEIEELVHYAKKRIRGKTEK